MLHFSAPFANITHKTENSRIEYGYLGPIGRLNVKKIALALERETLFDSEMMKHCTLQGKGKNKLALDRTKMDQIQAIIRKVCDRESEQEFEVIWTDVKTSIGQACKHTRRKELKGVRSSGANIYQ